MRPIGCPSSGKSTEQVNAAINPGKAACVSKSPLFQSRARAALLTEAGIEGGPRLRSNYSSLRVWGFSNRGLYGSPSEQVQLPKL